MNSELIFKCVYYDMYMVTTEVTDKATRVAVFDATYQVLNMGMRQRLRTMGLNRVTDRIVTDALSIIVTSLNNSEMAISTNDNKV